MKQSFLKLSVLAGMILLLHVPGFAQSEDKDTLSNKLDEYDEIVIKHKSDKDTKVSVEIKDGQVFVNGKPVAEFDDDNVSVRKKKIRVFDGQSFSFSGPGDAQGGGTFYAPGPSTRFRKQGGGAWSITPHAYGMDNEDQAVLGVAYEKAGDNVAGAKVKSLIKGGSAEKAGLKVGDVITKIDEIKIEESEDLAKAIHKYKPDAKVTVTYKREGKEQKVTAALGKLDARAYSKSYNFNYLNPGEDGDFNFKMPPMEQMNPMSPRNFSWGDKSLRLGIKAQDTEDGKGVKVLDVDDESSAEKAGIKEGDIITRFDGKDVNSATALAELARESKTKTSVKISLSRAGKSQEVEVKIPRKLKTADL